MKRMTKTGVLREIMRCADIPLSLREIQVSVEERSQEFITDGTISRRLREWGALCERDKYGVFRYSLARKEQGALFKGA